MKRSLIISFCGICCGLLMQAQDVPGSKDYALFPRVKGFTIQDYEVTEPTSYKFYDEGGTEMVVSGRMVYIYYECDCDIAPEKILSSVSANAKSLGGRFCAHDDTKLCMIVQQDNVEVWADLSAGNFYYTLRIIEKAEVDQTVTAESIKSDFATKGETVLYIRYSYRGDIIQSYSTPAVEALASVLKADAGLFIEIEGHTDSEGTDMDNKRLSLDRANALASEIIKAGVMHDRITCTGLGESAPIADTESTEGKALNRRIVVRVKK